MRRFRGPKQRHVLSAAKRQVLGTVAAQVAAITAVNIIDAMRKKRTLQPDRFPHLPPQSAQVGPNSMTIFTYGRELYDAMLTGIRTTKDRILFEWFIVKTGETGAGFRNALIKAVQQGIDTYVIIDARGNANQDPRFRRLPKMEHPHTPLFPFVRPDLFSGRACDKGRDHHKTLTVDKRAECVGGYNTGTLYTRERHDTHVQTEGPAAWELNNAFIDVWNDYHKKHHPAIADDSVAGWDATIRMIINTPALNVFPTSALYMDAIDRSAVRVWITMGYFIPKEPILIAMTNAARRGVSVRVLIPEYSNHVIGDWTGRPHYERLLRSKVHIFLYEKTMVRSKTTTVDGRWSTIGTTNIDRLSLRDNFEINVEVFDPGFTAAMERVFEVDLANSHELTLEQWQARGRHGRVLETVLRSLAPLL